MRKMKLRYQLLLYVDKRRFLVEMKKSCDEFLDQYSEKSSNKYPPLRHLLELDIMDLLDVFPDLGNFLIKEPLQFQQICNEILFACIKSIDNDDKQFVKPMQVAVTVRLKCFPQILSYPKQRSYGGLIIFTGLLMDILKPNSYVIHSVWSCPEECEGNEVILNFLPKVSLKCYVCRSVLFENGGLRRCGEQLIATFMSNNYPPQRKYFICDDLITKLKLGRIFNVYAVVLKHTTTVWSIEEVVTLPAPLTFPIPDDIEQLFEACEGVPWTFIYCLASSIGVRACPLHCFIHVKICLLLSLVSVKANSLQGSPIINVLVSGNETRYVGDLMKEATTFAQTSFLLGNANSSVKLTFIRSSGGVCVLPVPLYLYSQKQVALILKILESGTIATDSGEVEIKCAVWAHSNDLRKTNIRNLSSIFGTVCRGDYGEYADDLSEFMLQGAVAPMKMTMEEKNAIKDLTEYISLVAGVNVSLDRRAENLLKAYFIAARKERITMAPVGSIGALVMVSLTSAKLCRRPVATIDDAILAIWLHVSGSPEPRIAPEEYLQTPACTQKLTENMTHFKQWLEQFTGSNIS